MKNMKLVLAQVVVLLLFSISSALAAPAADLNIYIDDKQIPTVSSVLHDIYGKETDVLSRYYLEVKPEIHNGRVFVPIRIIAEYLDADITWKEPDVFLSLGEKTSAIKLTIGSRTAFDFKNNETRILEAAPYIKEGRTMVPIRFISETFDCLVDYRDNNVYIATPSLFINERIIVSVQEQTYMTIGGYLNESETNICISKLYRFLNENSQNETPEPEYYGTLPNLDTLNFYCLSRVISFMGSSGANGLPIQEYALYNNLTSGIDNYVWEGRNLGEWLIHDVTHGKWFQVSENDFFLRFLEIYRIGGWISNTF